MAIVNHVCLIDFPNIINWTGYFRLGMLGGIFHCIKILIKHSLNEQ